MILTGAASTFPIVARVLNAMNRRMYAATTLSSAKSISAESLNLRSDSNSGLLRICGNFLLMELSFLTGRVVD